MGVCLLQLGRYAMKARPTRNTPATPSLSPDRPTRRLSKDNVVVRTHREFRQPEAQDRDLGIWLRTSPSGHERSQAAWEMAPNRKASGWRIRRPSGSILLVSRGRLELPTN